MGQDNASITRAFYDAWNARDFDYGATHMSEDGTIELMGSGHMFKGPDGSRQYGESWAAAVPDGRVSIDRVVAAGDHVVVEFTAMAPTPGPWSRTASMLAQMGLMPG